MLLKRRDPLRSSSIPPSRNASLVQTQDTAPAVDRLQRPSRPADHLGRIELPDQHVLFRSPGPSSFRWPGSPPPLGNTHLRPCFGRMLSPSAGLPGRLHGTCGPWLSTLGSCDLGPTLRVLGLAMGLRQPLYHGRVRLRILAEQPTGPLRVAINGQGPAPFQDREWAYTEPILDSQRRFPADSLDQGTVQDDGLVPTAFADWPWNRGISYKAPEGQRQGTLYPQLLLACALAELDELGYFKSTGVREMLRMITHEEYELPSFSQHHSKFSTDVTRGPVLERMGPERRYKYRFRNSIMRPFVIMKGLQDGLLMGKLLEQLAAATGITGNENNPEGENFQKSLFD